MFLHQATISYSRNKTEKRVGRGSTRGKNSGKGNKGQNSRAGNSKRPNERDLISKIPKLRGHGKNRSHTVVAKPKQISINLSSLVNIFNKGDKVSPDSLYEKKLITLKEFNQGRIKILGQGDIGFDLHFTDFDFSDSAKEKIINAKGTVS